VLHLMTTSFWVAEPNGLDAFGQPTFGTVIRYTGRISSPGVARGRQAPAAATADATTVIFTSATVSADARVWLALADTSNPSKAMRPKSATTSVAPGGWKLTEVVL
jgi:hypothetical protein